MNLLVAKGIRASVAGFLGLLFVLGGVSVWMVGAKIEGITPGWVPTFREISIPITIAEILFGAGLIYPRTRRPSGVALAFVFFVAWFLTLYFFFIPSGAVTVSKGEIPAELPRWELTVHGQWDRSTGPPRLEVPANQPGTMRILITSTTRERQPWDIQLNRNGVTVLKDQQYVVRFRARASAVRPVNVSVGRAHGDYGSLGLYRELSVTEEWGPFQFVFNPTDDEPNARIFFDLGQDAHDVEISDVKLARTSETIPASNAEVVPVNSNSRSIGYLIVAGDTVTALQATVPSRTIWLQILSKPLWILILLWISGLLSQPVNDRSKD